MPGRPKGRKPRLMLTVPQDLHDLIKEIADARGVPMSSQLLLSYLVKCNLL